MKTALQSLAFLMIFLVIMLPVESAVALQAIEVKEGSTPLLQSPASLEVTLPENYNRRELLIHGTTTPGSTVDILAGEDRHLVASITPQSTADGSFEYMLRTLEEGENLITLTATDPSGQQSSREFRVNVDTQNPEYTLSSIPRLTAEESLVLTGTVNEESTITFLLESGAAVTIPKPENLQLEDVAANSLKLTWAPVEGYTYVVYRNNVRIAVTTTPQFIEASLNAGTTYTYQVAAVLQCNEGPRSDPLEAVTLSGEARETTEQEIPLACENRPEPIAITATGDFEQTLTLNRGVNRVTIIITDRANNSVTIQNLTALDQDPPVIETSNMERLDPSYSQEITIIGKVSKKATVLAFVNQPDLPSPLFTEPEQTLSDFINTEDVFSVETDESGNFALPVTLRRDPDIAHTERTAQDSSRLGILTQSEFRNAVTLVAVDDVGLESQQIRGQIRYSLCGSGGDWIITTSSITPDVIIPRLVLEGLSQVGFSAEFEWAGPGEDQDAVLQTPRLIDRPLSQEDADNYDEEWVRLSRPPSLDSPTRTSAAYFLLDIRQPRRQGDETTLSLENEISDHRLNECTIPGTGCLKIPLMLEIPYTYRDTYAPVNPVAGSSGFSGTPGRNTQEYLTGLQRQCWDVEITIDRRLPADAIPKAFLEGSVNVLESAIDIIDTVLRPVNTAKKWVFIGCLGSWAAWWVKKATEWSSCVGVSLSAGIPSCTPHPDDPNDPCANCLRARGETAKFWEKTQWICDRIMCPAAPTVQKYVRDAKKNTNEVPSHCSQQPVTDVDWDSKRGDEKWQEYWNPDNFLIEARPGSGPNNVGSNINQQYCEYEYIKEYDSVAVGLNEFKESYCLTPAGKEDAKCGGLQVFPRLIRGVCTGQTNERLVIATSAIGQRDTSYWVIDADPQSGDGSIQAAWEGEYNAEFRCDNENSQLERCDIGNTIANYVKKKEASPVLRVRESLGTHISGGAFCATRPRGAGEDAEEFIPYEEQPQIFQRKVPLGVYEQVCAEAKDYVIDPTSDLISAFQSICLTAISEYLNHYKQILLMVKNCFNTILVTGDGSAGICKQVLSIYICDLIYFAIKCIIEKAGRGFGGSRSEVRGGFSGFLSYISNSGAQTQNKIRSRYGSTGIYRSLFLERKLVHATCRFAFTGDWDYNIEGLLEQEVQVPIATTCYITGTRRFLTKDPSQQGRASFLYHLGVFIVAGAPETTYKVQLVCSGENTCDSDIDPNGNDCDCLHFRDGEQVIQVRAGPGRLRQGETINVEEFREEERPYRYDKARILISYPRGGNSDQEVRDEECAVVNLPNIGGPPPADCGFEGWEYHCAFDFGRYGVAYFDQNVRLKDEGQPGFFLGETIELDGAIVKNSPSETPQQTMYMKYTLYGNRENRQEQILENIIPLTADGTIPFASGIPGGPFPGFKIVSTPTNLQNRDLNPFETSAQATAIQQRGIQAANEPITVEFSNPLAQFIGFRITITKNDGQYTLNSENSCFNTQTTRTATTEDLAAGVQCTFTENGQAQTITLRGSFTDTANTIPLTISLQPRRPQPEGSHKTLTLRISLHYASEEPGHTFDPSIIRWNGAEQAREFPIAVNNRPLDASYQVVQGATLLGCAIGSLLTAECGCGSLRCGGGNNEYCCNSGAPYCRRGTVCNRDPPLDTGITYSIEYNGEEQNEGPVNIPLGQTFTFKANNIRDDDPGIYKVEFILGNNVRNLRQTWAPYLNSVDYEAPITTDGLIDGSTYETKLKITDGDGNIRDTTTPRSIQITAPATT